MKSLSIWSIFNWNLPSLLLRDLFLWLSVSGYVLSRTIQHWFTTIWVSLLKVYVSSQVGFLPSFIHSLTIHSFIQVSLYSLGWLGTHVLLSQPRECGDYMGVLSQLATDEISKYFYLWKQGLALLPWLFWYLLGNPFWPQTLGGPSASASQVYGLQIYNTTHDFQIQNTSFVAIMLD